MVKRCPFAIWKPAVHFGYIENGKPLVLVPNSLCAHSTDGPPGSEPDPRFFDKDTDRPGSVHFWINDVGTLWQLLDLDVPAWGNGNDYSTVFGHAADMDKSPVRVVREFYAQKVNPNKRCISVEFTGRGASRGTIQKLTPAQIETWKNLELWLRVENILDVDETNLFLHQHVARTLCPDGRFTTKELMGYITSSKPTEGLLEQRIANLEKQVQDISAILAGNGVDDRAGQLLTGNAAIQHAKERGFSAILSGQRAHQRIGELALVVSELSSNPNPQVREVLIELLEEMIEGVKQ